MEVVRWDLRERCWWRWRWMPCWVGPSVLFARIGHPVTWLGSLIGALDTWWNRPTDAPNTRRMAGVAAALTVIALAAGAGWLVQRMMPSGWSGVVLTGVLAWPLVALRSLYDHVTGVRNPLAAGDVVAARKAVSMIVGRDPNQLEEAGIARAAIESLAENASDGVVAPLFWGALFGLPGIAGYKAINTLDSMIGHRSERHEAFGWAAARIDDVANFIPARLTGFYLRLCRRHRKHVACDVMHAQGWPAPSLAQCGLAGGGHGGQPWRAVVRAARL